MSRNTLSKFLILVGVILFVVSLIADYINPFYYPGYNSAQIAGMAVGVLALLIGLLLHRSEKTK